ncbi:Os11g0563600 [Oryza sativa Japonica Group]|uniref:Os11g0563600 protein n=1 Tax=Oryza sativa subsp. japonica TaxID=39947 RepID=A0A0P0Y3F0_ORYSJ|nr:Os11g0563600 [Oryza sativa Japonica Group]
MTTTLPDGWRHCPPLPYPPLSSPTLFQIWLEERQPTDDGGSGGSSPMASAARDSIRSLIHGEPNFYGKFPDKKFMETSNFRSLLGSSDDSPPSSNSVVNSQRFCKSTVIVALLPLSKKYSSWRDLIPPSASGKGPSR